MEWFLIQEDEHLGPFSADSISEKFDQGELQEDSLVWQEGWVEPRSYKDVFMAPPISHVIENEPELPPIPDLPPIPVETSVIPPSLPIEEDIVIEIPPLPDLPELPIEVEPVNISIPDTPEFVAEETSLVERGEEYQDEIAPIKPKKKYKLLISIFFIFITLFIIAGIIYKTKPQISRPTGMGQKDFKRLERIAHRKSAKTKFSFALAQDKRTLWVATNNPLSGMVYFELETINGKSLGEPIRVKSSGYLKNHLISLKNFQFERGVRLVEGKYKIHIYTTKKFEEPFINRFIGSKNKKMNHSGEVIISSFSPRVFKKMLRKANKKKKKNENVFWIELREEYRTIKNITKQIRESLSKVFSKDTLLRGKHLKDFEDLYKTNFGIFFTGFVINIDKKYNKLINKKFEDKTKVISHYTKLKKLAIEIGRESVKHLENLKSIELEKVAGEDFKELKYNSLMKYNLIVDECEKMIKELN
jgi:hypothetical protein